MPARAPINVSPDAESQKEEKPVKTPATLYIPKPDEKGLSEIQLSARTTVKIKPLGAFESIQADEISGGGETNETKINKVYAICSIREINGTVVFPLQNRVEFAALAEKLDMGELLLLVAIVSQQLGESFTADLKNVLAAQASG